MSARGSVASWGSLTDAHQNAEGGKLEAIKDRDIDAWYSLDNVPAKCPEDGRQMIYDYETDTLICPLCGGQDHN